jgi:hypothetical protein
MLRAMMVGDYFQDSITNMQIVFRVGDYYGVHYSISELKKLNEWQREQFSYYIDPSKFKVGDEWIFYIWNPDKTSLLIDNTNFILFQ